jgi:hypothetical protein
VAIASLMWEAVILLGDDYWGTGFAPGYAD